MGGGEEVHLNKRGRGHGCKKREEVFLSEYLVDTRFFFYMVHNNKKKDVVDPFFFGLRTFFRIGILFPRFSGTKKNGILLIQSSQFLIISQSDKENLFFEEKLRKKSKNPLFFF